MFEARRYLMMLKVQDWPNLKKPDRDRLWKELHKAGYPDAYKAGKRALTTKELAAILSGMK